MKQKILIAIVFCSLGMVIPRAKASIDYSYRQILAVESIARSLATMARKCP